MNIFRNFMIGRYGTDQLSLTLLIIGMVLTFISNAFDLNLLVSLTYIIFLVCLFRIMSKNISARRKENYKFLKYYNPAMAWTKAKYNAIKSSKDYKYFNCPNCKKHLRAPRGKGKISVTCPKCGTKFIQKS